MTHTEADELLDLAGAITKTMRKQAGANIDLWKVRDRLLELAGAVDCRHCESDNGCKRCVMGWSIPEVTA